MASSRGIAGSVIFVLVMLVAGGTGCQREGAGSLYIDPAFVPLLPDDTNTLAGVKVKALKETPVYARASKLGPLEGLNRRVEEIGLDPSAEILEVMLASNGKDTLTMARGKFSKTGLEPELKGPAIQRFTYRGYTLQGNEEYAAVFMNPSTMVAGPTRMLRSVLDRRDAGRTGPKNLLERAQQLPQGSHVWAVATGPSELISDVIPREGNSANLGRVIGSLQSGSVAVNLSRGADLEAKGTCGSEEEARNLASTLKGLIGLGRLSTPDNQPEMLRAYDAIQVTQSGTSIQVVASLPTELVEKLMDQAARFGSPGGMLGGRGAQ
jgi:hypothetical protein